MNEIILQGNLGKDPELKETNGGLLVCNFTLATNKKKKDGAIETQWHDIVCFNQTAKIASEFKKGSKIILFGELTYKEYTTESGQRKKYANVLAKRVYGCDQKQSFSDDLGF